ncbi:Protein kinase domain-containing protein [Caenorhabditis elegans]|uniref:Protein kinase domain-containing protein n=1 Tax=Caenorhabditis elegans TaxID=6239 RepID=Q93344_CAEEL|nr:Protein kinase domain-containing protein [Caenorhabditis elegans]CAB02275.1 Protein kinase domain-containing protein [Caenorhabditis elegans]|eukprot:NP_492367.1 Glycogen Synthase Kinase Alpha subunit [Caenorhabditis elegans]
MPNTYRTSDEIVAQRLEDGRDMNLSLQNMNLFASGAFSNVYRGIARTESNHQMEIVIKKTWPRHKGCPLEVKILGKLGKLKHKNIVRLLFSYQKQHEGRICLGLIFEYIPMNLHQFLKDNNRRVDIIEVKLIVWQLFRGQAHLEKSEICHRDIKPQNLLYNADTGLLKISDYGSSAIESVKTPQQSYHVTRYYRPPELLLGSKNYGCKIDTWSCGCVFGELLKGGIFLAGKSAKNQAEVVFDMFGVPTAEDVSSMNVSNTKYKEIIQSYEPDTSKRTADLAYLYNQTASFQRDRRSTVYNTKIDYSDMKDSVELLRQVLVYNPSRRLCGIEFLTNPFFTVLFNEKTVRFNKKKIQCVSAVDLQAVKSGDVTLTNESVEHST